MERKKRGKKPTSRKYQNDVLIFSHELLPYFVQLSFSISFSCFPLPSLKTSSPNDCLMIDVPNKLKKHEGEVRQMNRLNVIPIFIRNYTKKLKTSRECSSSFQFESYFVAKFNVLILNTLHSELGEDW